MPEGDTIHRQARRLRPVLVSRRATVVMPRAATPPPSPVVVTEIRVHGKHLLVDLAPHSGDPVVLHVHLGMPGRWDIQRPAPGTPPRGRDLLVALTSDVGRATCRRAPVVELLEPGRLYRHRVLGRLGPDLAGELDLSGVVAAVRDGRPRSIHETLLDQRLAAGIGNVLAVEACHLAGLDPRRTTDDLSDARLRDVYARARQLLIDNIDRPRRTTVPDARPGTLWVYRRHGRPCRHCGTTLVTTDLGRNARHVTWCPRCQPASRDSTDASPGHAPAPPHPRLPRQRPRHLPRHLPRTLLRRPDRRRDRRLGRRHRRQWALIVGARPRAAMTLSPSHLRAFRSLLEAHARLLDALNQRFGDRQLSLTHYDVLVHLSEATDQRLRMQQLADRVLLSKSGLTRLVDRMEQRGLVRREASHDDARGVNAVLTPDGLAALEAAVPAHRQDLVDLVESVMTVSEADQLADLLIRIRDRALAD